MPIAISVHALAAAIWVGGMFFAYVALRPSVLALEAVALRFDLWVRVFTRFTRIVWVCIVALLGTGYWMVAALGGLAKVPRYVHVMLSLGIFMMLLALHLYFGPFRRFKQAVVRQDFEPALAKLREMKVIVAVNTIVGFVVMITGSAGPYL